jgi:hypothetical protein
MKDYNIPASFLRDIATAGTYSHRHYRFQLWYDWSEKQRESALSRYTEVLEKLEKLCKIKEEHAQFFGGTSTVWFAELSQVIAIDCGEQYTPKQMLELVEQAIQKENKAFEAEQQEFEDDCYEALSSIGDMEF